MENITASEISIGNHVSIHPSASVKCKKLVIGDNVCIEERTRIICTDGTVVIGDNTYIGNDVTVMLKSLQIGEYTKLHNHCLLNGKASVTIGHNCWIGQNCNLNGEADLSIGNNVGIGTYSSIWTHGYFGELIEGCSLFSIKPTVIEDDVWLVGSYNTVFPGVTIKKKTVLLGTSVITRSTEENNIYSGNPAQKITEQAGVPYRTISVDEKIAIIRKTLLEHLPQAFEEGPAKIAVKGLGSVYFLSAPGMDTEDTVCFAELVEDWQVSRNISLFCLTTKYYSRTKTPLEIAVRKILNPVAARFIPIEH